MIATLDGGTSASRSHQADHVTAKPAKRTIEAASKSMAAAENLVQATARGRLSYMVCLLRRLLQLECSDKRLMPKNQ